MKETAEIHHSCSLPAAILGNNSSLSPQAREEIMKLGGAKPVQFILQILQSWMIISGAIWAAESIDTTWAKGLALIFIASRMNILGLLVHEQAHFLGLRGKWSDTITNLWTAYPLLFFSVEGYAKVHLSHHRWFFTNQDPDLERKSGPDWTFPMSKWHLAKLFLSDFTGLSVAKFIRGKKSDVKSFTRPYPTPKWIRPIFLISLILVLFHFSLWQVFLIYWIVPLLFIFPAIARLGAITEHVYIPGGSIEETSPIVIQLWYERLILPNLNFSMHPYHHWHPGVAWCNLQKVHQIYKKEGIVKEENIFRGYYDYISFLQNSNRSLVFAPNYER